jgi:hypothetical protein
MMFRTSGWVAVNAPSRTLPIRMSLSVRTFVGGHGMSADQQRKIAPATRTGDRERRLLIVN